MGSTQVSVGLVSPYLSQEREQLCLVLCCVVSLVLLPSPPSLAEVNMLGL